MPIYEYRCPECGNEQEVVLSFGEFNLLQMCSNCGKPAERRMSIPHRAICPMTGRGKVMATLNKEGGRDFPGGDMHRPRYEQAMAKGLEQRTSQYGQFRPINGARA